MECLLYGVSLASLTIKVWYSFGSKNDQKWILITKIEKVNYKRNRNWMTGGSEFGKENVVRCYDDAHSLYLSLSQL